MENLSGIKEKLAKVSAKRAIIKEQGIRISNKLKMMQDTLELTLKTQKLMQECGYATLAGLSVRISNIVTTALQSVFPDPYEFSLDFDIKYGRLSASMVLFRDGEAFNPNLDNGDGVLDIVALALRTAVLCLDKRKLRRVLILDEPCGALSVDMQPFAGKLMKHLNETLGIQFIMVGAHGNAYREYADKEFHSSDFSVLERI